MKSENEFIALVESLAEQPIGSLIEGEEQGIAKEVQAM